MCWKILVNFSLTGRFVEKELRQSTGAQPGETTLIRQPAITVQAMPAELNAVQMNTRHRLYWIPKDRFDVPDFFAQSWFSLVILLDTYSNVFSGSLNEESILAQRRKGAKEALRNGGFAPLRERSSRSLLARKTRV